MRLPIKVIKKIYKPLMSPLNSKIIEATQLIEQIRVEKEKKKYKPETLIYKSSK